MAKPVQNNSHPAKRSGIISPTLIGAVFLGICILIAGLNIGGGLRKLNKTITETQFSDINAVNIPSDMFVGQKSYMTVDEAADYLNLTPDEIKSMITGGEISEYVRTESGGYSISVKVLDEWFDNEAYNTKIRNNTVSGGNDSVSDEDGQS